MTGHGRKRRRCGTSPPSANTSGRRPSATFSSGAHAYSGDWRPTEQVPERIIGSAVCPDVFCSPDPSADGRTRRLVLNGELKGQAWRGEVNLQRYDWEMTSNPTYANADGSSAQIRQFDHRWVAGGRVARDWRLSDSLQLTAGGEARYDHIAKVGVHNTDAGAFVSSAGEFGVREGSLAAYAEANWRPLEALRVTGGVRQDYYGFKVSGRDRIAEALGTGTGDAAIVSPRVSAAYKAADWLELYASWGRGFHSNDVRGVVNRDTPVDTLAAGTGAEVGARIAASAFTLTATYWGLDLDSELRFVGDTNSVEPTEASERRGVEVVGFWRPYAWLAIDANYTASRSRYVNGDRIPNAFESAGQVGVSIVRGEWEGALRWRHLGPSPLIEDNSVRDRGSDVVNARAAWNSRNYTVYGEVLNLLDSADKDIAYYYQSYIPNFDAAPVEGRLSRVVEPRTLRIGLKRQF